MLSTPKAFEVKKLYLEQNGEEHCYCTQARLTDKLR